MNMAAIWNTNLEVASAVINLQEAEQLCVIGIAEKVIYFQTRVIANTSNDAIRCGLASDHMDLDENTLRILSKTIVDDRDDARIMVKV